MQNFGKNVSKMQHYGLLVHLLGRIVFSFIEGPDIMNSGGNL